MMKIVAPLRVHSETAGFTRCHNAWVIQIAFRDQYQPAAKSSFQCFHFARQLLKENEWQTGQRTHVQRQAEDRRYDNRAST
jgi:hypothetical protein